MTYMCMHYKKLSVTYGRKSTAEGGKTDQKKFSEKRYEHRELIVTTVRDIHGHTIKGHNCIAAKYFACRCRKVHFQFFRIMNN